MINIFALVQRETIHLLRIPLNAQVQAELTGMFIEQVTNFTAEKEQIDYSGDYKADPEEIFRIQEFPIPPSITNGVQNPMALEILDINDYDGKIISIVASSTDGNNPFIGFQYFDTRKLLNKNYSLWFTNEMYNKIDDKGITIGSKLDLLITGTTLFFTSFSIANRVLDLSNYMQIATDEDLDTFVDSDLFEFEDSVGFRDDLTVTMKKKLRIIVQSGIIEEIGFQAIYEKAQELEIHLELNEYEDKLSIPRDRNRAKDLIRLLNEDYFISILKGTKYLTNSKRAT